MEIMINQVKKMIFDILDENGIYIDSEEMKKDIDLREYLVDSLQYIYFVVALEEKMGIELPDEVLVYDYLSSINGFANMILDIQQNVFHIPDDCESSFDMENTDNCCIINMSNC